MKRWILPIALATLLLLVILVRPFTAAPAPEPRPATEEVTEAMRALGYTAVPLRKNAMNEYEVEAFLNGDKKITMLINFQGTSTIFNTQELDKLGVKYEKTDQDFEVNGDSDDLYTVLTDSINIGDGKIGSEELFCIKFKEFDVFKSTRTTAMLGREFLLKHHAVLDFANQVLYIKPA